MKRMLSLVVAVTMLLTALVLPTPAVHAEGDVTVVPFARKYGTGLETGVTDNINGESFIHSISNGTITITYNVPAASSDAQSAWVEYYNKHGMPKQTIGMEGKPDNAKSGACLMIDGDKYTQEQVDLLLAADNGLWRGGENGVDSFFREIDLLQIAAVNGAPMLQTNDSVTTFLLAWKDENGDLISVEALKVVIKHNNPISEPIDLPAVVPFDPDSGAGYGFDHFSVSNLNVDSGSGNGNLEIVYQIEKDVWAEHVKSTGVQQHQIDFVAPQDAAQIALYIPQGDTETDDAIATKFITAGGVSWQESSREQGPYMYRFNVMDYETEVNADGDTIITYQPIEKEFDIYVAWKDGNNNLIDLGIGQYVAKMHVKVAHNLDGNGSNESWTENLGDQSVDSLYTFAVPMGDGRVLGIGIPGVEKDCFEYDLSKLEDGKLTVKVKMTAEDWKSAYEALDMPGTPISYRVWVKKPAEDAAFANVVLTGSNFNEELVNGMLASPHNEVFGELELARTAANQSTNGSNVTIVPVSGEHTFLVSWKKNGNDDAPNYNLGTLINPYYAEYLTITLVHENTDAVKFESDVIVEGDKITTNAFDLEKELFTREAEYENETVTYFVDGVKLQEAMNSAAEDQKNKYHVVGTFVEAPEGATAVKVGDMPKYMELAEHNGKKGVYLVGETVRIENNEVRVLYDAYGYSYSIRWQMEDDTEAKQMIQVVINVIGDKLWYDDVLDAKPIKQTEILIAEEFSTGSHSVGVELKMTEDGHLTSALTGEKIKHNQLEKAQERQVLIKVPEGAKYYKSADGAGSNMYLGRAMAEEMARYLQSAELHEIELDEKNSGYMAIGHLATVKKVTVAGALDTTVEVTIPEVIGYSDYCAAHEHIQWFDENKEPIALKDGDVKYFTQYWYYTQGIKVETNEVRGVGAEDDIKAPVKHPTIVDEEYKNDFVLETEEFEQEQVGGEAKTRYMRIRLMQIGSNAPKQPDKQVDLYIPYPDGLDYEKCKGGKHKFVVRHYLDDEHTKFEDIEFQPMPYGLKGKIKSFSPFVISWIEEEESGAGSGTTGGNNGGGTQYYPDYSTKDEQVPAVAEKNDYIVLCRKLNVRAGAGTQYDKIGSLRRGQVVNGEMLDNGWLKITLEDDSIGYVCARYVELLNGAQQDVCGIGSVVCRKLNVRAGAGTQYDKIGSLRRGEPVEIIGKNAAGTWLKIKWNDQAAWVCAKYIFVEN